MRQELAILLSPMISLAVSGPIVLFDDGRAQYGLALIAAGLLPLVFSTFMIPIHLAISKFTRGTLSAYALTGATLGGACAILLFRVNAGLIASIFGFVWLFVSFFVFRLLIRTEP